MAMQGFAPLIVRAWFLSPTTITRQRRLWGRTQGGHLLQFWISEAFPGNGNLEHGIALYTNHFCSVQKTSFPCYVGAVCLSMDGGVGENKARFKLIKLYNTMLSTEYNIFVSTYLFAKTERLTIIKGARGSKQMGAAVQLYFLTCKESTMGRLRSSIQYSRRSMTSLHHNLKTWLRKQCTILFRLLNYAWSSMWTFCSASYFVENPPTIFLAAWSSCMP